MKDPMKDPDSKISQLLRIQNSEDPQIAKEVAEERAYHMLDELRVHPNVFYLRKVRNIDETSHA